MRRAEVDGDFPTSKRFFAYLQLLEPFSPNTANEEQLNSHSRKKIQDLKAIVTGTTYAFDSFEPGSIDVG